MWWIHSMVACYYSKTSLSEAKPSSEEEKSYIFTITHSKHNCSILFFTCNSLFYIQWYYTYINLAQLEVPLFIIPQQNCNACSSISLTALEFHFGLMATTAWKVVIPDLPDLSCELKARNSDILPPPLTFVLSIYLRCNSRYLANLKIYIHFQPPSHLY